MSLLPPNATPLERALERGAQLGAVGAGAEAIDDPAAAPAAALPWLAWGLSVDNWDPDWPEPVKRQAIADSIALHRMKGTRASVETVLARMDDLANIVEWHEAQPRRDPHTFEIHVPLVREVGAAGGRRAGAAFVTDIIREVGRVKPLREHLRVVQSLVMAGGVGVTGAARLASWRRDAADLAIDMSPDWLSCLQTEEGEPIVTEAGALLGTDRVGFDFMAGRMPPGARISRPTPASATGPGGRLRYEPADRPRFAWSAAGRLRGLLVEAQAANLLRRSDQIAAGPWLTNTSRVTPDAAVAPDGTTTADQFEARAGETGFYQSFVVTPGQALTYSGYVRLGSLSPEAYRLALRDDTAGTFFALDIIVDAQLRADRWARVVHGFRVPDGCTSLRVYPFRYQPAAGTFFSWGHQLETGRSSYIPTAASTVTRAADVLTLDWRSRGLPDGGHVVRYTFDDGSTQDVPTEVAAGFATAPALNRPILCRAEASRS